MSIPTDALRYAGIWDAVLTYKYAMFVVSPIDNGAYVWTDDTPVTGGADPSTGVPNWVVIPPIATGDITGIIAGTGITGGGSSGVVTIGNSGVLSVTANNGCSSSGGQNPNITNTGVLSVTASNGCASSGGQNPNITNTGVLSLDGFTGAVSTQAGQWYKSAGNPQSIGGVIGTAVPTTITFDTPTSWSNITSLQWSPANNLWNVNTKGLYHLQCQLAYADMNVPNFGDETHLININVGRALTTNSPIRTAFDWKDSDPTNPDNFVAGIYELQVGDKVQIQVVDHFQTTDAYTILAQSGGANSYDYNTFFTWVLIKPLP